MTNRYRIAALDADLVAAMSDDELAQHIARADASREDADREGVDVPMAEADGARLLDEERERRRQAADRRAAQLAEATGKHAKRVNGRSRLVWFYVNHAAGLALVQAASGAAVEDACRRHGFAERGLRWEPLDGMTYGKAVVGEVTVIPAEY